MISIDPILARKQLQMILEKEEYQIYYQEKQQNLLFSLLNSFKDWLSDKLEGLFPDIKISEGFAEGITYAISAIGILLFIILILWLLSKIVKEGKISRKTVGTAEDLALPLSKHLEESKAYANKDDYRLALRHLFLALILHLNSEKLIDAKPWKTNWEYYFELNDHDQDKANSFRLIATKFDEVMYGGMQINKEEYLDLHNNVIIWIDNDLRLRTDHNSFDKEGGMI